MALDGIVVSNIVAELNANLAGARHSFAVTYVHLSLESLLFPCF